MAPHGSVSTCERHVSGPFHIVLGLQWYKGEVNWVIQCPSPPLFCLDGHQINTRCTLCNVINACIHLLLRKRHSAALAHDSAAMNGWSAKYRKCIKRENLISKLGMDSPRSSQSKTLSAASLKLFQEVRSEQYILSQPWLWIPNAAHASAHQANISRWRGQRSAETGRRCICCCCHSYPLPRSPLIWWLDNSDLETHCWWAHITQTQAGSGPRRAAGVARLLLTGQSPVRLPPTPNQLPAPGACTGQFLCL